MDLGNHKDKSKRKYMASFLDSNMTLINIDKHIHFTESISELIFSNGHIDTAYFNGKTFLMQTELIDSSINTLKSIKICLEVGHFSDVNVLLRKFRDDLFLYLYFLEICNNNGNNKVAKQMEHAVNWMENNMSNLQIGDMIEFLTKNKTIGEAIHRHDLRKTWDSIRKDLNNFVHSNGKRYSYMNYARINDEQVIKSLDDVINKVGYILSVFLVFLILIKPSIIASSDYFIALDLGIEPVEGSQYYVAPFIQCYVDENLASLHPKIKTFLKANVYMDIE